MMEFGEEGSSFTTKTTLDTCIEISGRPMLAYLTMSRFLTHVELLLFHMDTQGSPSPSKHVPSDVVWFLALKINALSPPYIYREREFESSLEFELNSNTRFIQTKCSIKQSHVCIVMSKQPIKLSSVEIELPKQDIDTLRNSEQGTHTNWDAISVVSGHIWIVCNAMKKVDTDSTLSTVETGYLFKWLLRGLGRYYRHRFLIFSLQR